MTKPYIDLEKVKATFKSVRKELGLTQVEFASLLDTSVTTLNDWETTGKATGSAVVLVNMIHNKLNKLNEKLWRKEVRNTERQKIIENLLDDLEASKSFKVSVELEHFHTRVYYPRITVTTLHGITELDDLLGEGLEVFIGDGISDETGETVITEGGIEFDFPYFEGVIEGASPQLEELIHDEIKAKIGNLAEAEYERMEASK